MHVIYVHGVSERPESYEFDRTLRLRRQAFANFVSKRLDRGIVSFEAAGWGDLCPNLALCGRGQRLGPSGASTVFTPDPVRWQDFLTREGYLRAAPFLEAGLLRDQTLSEAQLNEGRELIDEISEADITVLPPQPNETTEQIVERIAAARPAAGKKAQSLDIGSNRMLNALARSLEIAVTPFGGRPRDVIATELAARWVDIVWYFGRGRAEVRARIIQRFADITRKSPDVPVVVLGHSLGGFIAHEAITSPAFIERGLAERGPWLLFCLGSQLTIFDKIGLMERGLKLGRDLTGRVRYRNIVDPNDPLGFKAEVGDEPEIDVPVHSGTNFLSAHGTYLDSPIVLGKIRTELRRLLRELGV